MNNPNGLTIDGDNHLWVAETDYQPKRVSLWTLDGKLLKAFYGPSEYGGGGGLDPQDKTRFYYHGMEFKLDWEKGTDRLAAVLFRPGPADWRCPGGIAAASRKRRLSRGTAILHQLLQQQSHQRRGLKRVVDRPRRRCRARGGPGAGQRLGRAEASGVQVSLAEVD